MSNAFVEVRDLTRRFDVSAPLVQRLLTHQPRRSVLAVDGLNFEIARGQTLGLVGESGCGKSTVARLLVGLDRPDAGEVRLDGLNLTQALAGPDATRHRHRLQMVFQDPHASLNPRWTVHDIVAEPLVEHGLAKGRTELSEQVVAVLTSVGLSAQDLAKHPHQFSGGQRQRISIARALAASPEFIVCDEPTSALDVSVQAQVLNLMRDLQAERGLTYLFISHNLAVVRQVSHQVGVMLLGRIVERADTATLFARPRHPYTRMLLDAIPDVAMRSKPPMPLVGDAPNPMSPPSGCAFHPRCPLANARCRIERPALLAMGATDVACHAVEEGRA